MDANPVQPFAQFSYQRINLDLISTEIQKARTKLRLAISPAAAVQTVRGVQSLLRLYQTQAAVARIRHDLKTDDPFYAAEQDYYDQADAQVTQLTQLFYTTMLGSRHRPELEAQFGGLIFQKAQNLKESVRPEIVADLVEENRLSSEYLQKMSEASVQINGQTMTLPQLKPLQQSPDRPVRIRSHQAQAAWFEENRENLDQLFAKLVAVRSRISHKLGLATFTELGYKRMERFDYHREQVENLRRDVIRYIVPMTREIRRLQRKRLNLEHLFYYDLPCLFPAGNPPLLPGSADLMPLAEQILAKLTRQSPSFFQKLIDGGYLDLAARANKTPGGYCSTVINANMPFILTNASGTGRDVSTLIHESGHAYASLRAMADMTLVEYLNPTMETCEIHSTALEFLSYPHMDTFFGAEAENSNLMHMTEALLFIPYGCLVDEYQHTIYDQPKLSPRERHQVWRDLEKTYLPDLDYGEEPFFNQGGAWQMKEHIFVAPFYYIDYVLAQLVSLDIWQTGRKKPDQAWQSYDRLCGMSGRDTFLSLLERAGLASPFDTGTIKRVAYAASDFLDL